MANPALRMLRTEEVIMPEGRHPSRPIRSSHDTIRVSRVDRHMSRVTAWHRRPIERRGTKGFPQIAVGSSKLQRNLNSFLLLLPVQETSARNPKSAEPSYRSSTG